MITWSPTDSTKERRVSRPGIRTFITSIPSVNAGAPCDPGATTMATSALSCVMLNAIGGSIPAVVWKGLLGLWAIGAGILTYDIRLACFRHAQGHFPKWNPSFLQQSPSQEPPNKCSLVLICVRIPYISRIPLTTSIFSSIESLDTGSTVRIDE